MKKHLTRPDLYHDKLLATQVSCNTNWLELNVRDLVEVERDRQLISLQFLDSFEIDLEADGMLRHKSGHIINPDIKLITDDGVEYVILFSGARGKHIATFRPEQALPKEEAFERLLIKCQNPLSIEKILWTTYDIKDMK